MEPVQLANLLAPNNSHFVFCAGHLRVCLNDEVDDDCDQIKQFHCTLRSERMLLTEEPNLCRFCNPRSLVVVRAI